MNQVEQVLQYIKDFGSITTYDSFVDLGITRLASRINDLVNLGYEFDKTWITKKNKYGKTVSFLKYSLK